MTGQAKVLVIEDNPIDYELVRRALQRSHQTVHASTADEGIRLLSAHEVACVLLDYRLPDVDGIEVLSTLVESDVPIVLMTGHGDTQVAVDAMKRGAADYLSKDHFDPDTLVRTIGSAVERWTLKRDLARREGELRALAEKLPAIVWTVDPSGRIITLSGNRVELLGPHGANAHGRRWSEVFGAILDAEELERLAAAHASSLSETAARFELRVQGRTFELS